MSNPASENKEQNEESSMGTTASARNKIKLSDDANADMSRAIIDEKVAGDADDNKNIISDGLKDGDENAKDHPAERLKEEKEYLGDVEKEIPEKKKVVKKLTDPNEVEYTEVEGEDLVQKCHENIEIIKAKFDIDTYRDSENAELRNAMLRMKKNYYMFKHAGVIRSLAYRRRVGVDMVTSGVADILCKIVIHTLEQGWLTEENTVDTTIYNPFNNAFTVLFNFSDATPELAIEFTRVCGFIEALMNKLKELYERTVVQELEVHVSEETFARSDLGLLHNTANVDENKSYMRKIGLSQVLFDYMNHSKVEKQRLCAILGLADILTEEESKQLQADIEGVKFMLRRLTMAVNDPQFRSMGWSAKELARGLEKLANNDINKQMLVDNGVLPTLNKMTRLDGYDENLAGVCALRSLSFAEYNKDKIIAEEGLIDRLSELENTSEDKELANAAERTLWNLRDKLMLHEKYKHLSKEFVKMEESIPQEDQPHVMISYNWKHQDLVIEICKMLQSRGCKVWMDVNNMLEGSTLECMARGVEQSYAVIICMSQFYKDSANCRMEFEYAFKCKKLLIPLIIQEEYYRPDGWLGLVIGNMLYHDFTGKYTFESRIEGVVKALGKHQKPGASGGGDKVDTAKVETLVVPVKTAPLSSTTIVPITPVYADSINRDSVTSWNASEVKQWIKDNGITSNSKTGRLTGRQLVFLWELKLEAPEFFYKLIESQLKLASIEEIMIFARALKRLFC